MPELIECRCCDILSRGIALGAIDIRGFRATPCARIGREFAGFRSGIFTDSVLMNDVLTSEISRDLRKFGEIYTQRSRSLPIGQFFYIQMYTINWYGMYIK